MRQRGFTLLELLVALAVGSVIITGALLTVNQVILGTLRARSQTVALNDVNFAAERIKKDIQMVQNTNLTEGVPQSSVTLTWTDYTRFTSVDETPHSSMYTLSGTELLRTYDGTAGIAGRHISSIEFTRNDRVIKVDITATETTGGQQRSKTLSFSMRMRTEPITP